MSDLQLENLNKTASRDNSQIDDISDIRRETTTKYNTMTDYDRYDIKQAFELFQNKYTEEEDSYIITRPQTLKLYDVKVPRDTSPKTLQLYREEAAHLLSSFVPYGTISNLIINRYNIDTRKVLEPPTIAQILLEISENKTYKQEKYKYLKAYRNGRSHLSGINLSSSFSALRGSTDLENFSLMTDIGDIMLNYGSITCFKSSIPKECLEHNYYTIADLFEKYLPRNAFGVTLTIGQTKYLAHDCLVHLFLEESEVYALFSRAIFLQNKYVCDYCSLNNKKECGYKIYPDLINFDFMEVSNDVINVEKPKGTGRYPVGGSLRVLNYIGLIQFIYMLGYTILKKYNPAYLMEQPTYHLKETSQNKNDDAPDADDKEFLYQNFDLAVVNVSNTKRITYTTARDVFAPVEYLTSINNQVKVTPNNSYSKMWKAIYAFGCFMDCYVLKFAKRYGVNIKSSIMTAYVQQDAESVKMVMRYMQLLYKEFTRSTKGEKLINKEQLCKFLQGTGIIANVSKHFVTEYIIRNYTNYDNSFNPCLTFEETVNCLYVGANLAFSAHPYVVYLKTAAKRVEFALKNMFDASQ